MHKPIRRIVTGHDAKGVAVVIEDRDAPNVRTVELRGGRAALGAKAANLGGQSL